MKMSLMCRWARELCVDYLSISRGVCSSASVSNKEGSTPKKEWYSPHTPTKKESWNIPDEPAHPRNIIPEKEWKGLLQSLAPSPTASRNLMAALQKGVDLRPSAIQKWLKSLSIEAAAIDQAYKQERVDILGYDLAAAHFLVHRGAKIRFKDATDWVQQNEDGEYDLARHYQPDVYVEDIDASGMNLVYEGLESMINLKSLKSLSVARCSHIDDWCLDRICGEYGDTLEHLDISECTKVTSLGVSALVRLRQLRTLKLDGLDGLKDIKFICLLLLDDLPQLKISGINYIPSSPLH